MNRYAFMFIIFVLIVVGGYIASNSMSNAIKPQLDYSQLQTPEQRKKASLEVIIIFAPFIIFFGAMTYLTQQQKEW